MKSFVSALLLFICSSAVAEPRIWFSPLSSVTTDKTGAADFMNLFEPNAPWQEVAHAISVFKLYPYFVGRARDADLKRIFSYLAKRHVSVALEARVLTSTRGCTMQHGDGGESTVHLLDRIKRLGGKFDYLAMDEPLKHALAGDVRCRASLDAVVSDIRENVAQFRLRFPTLEIGDIEPVGDWRNAPTLLPDTLSFVDKYQKESGEKLAFFHADVGWTVSWTGITETLQKELSRRGVPFGIIYNGEDLANSDELWAKQAVDHFQQFEACGKKRPDDVIFQTWRSHPTKVLPESDPTTLTGVADVYLHKKDC